MSSYVLFAGDHYYPSGGMNDYQGTFESSEEAKNYFATMLKEALWNTDWAQVVEINETGVVRVDQYVNDKWLVDE